ncbi:YfhH family protein [Salirhabdus sp. Marseille-P4669]|uniref:YfhH family protein n=1 Tax=Salirhabdus sp. Marseille-P4669 TaxID=2042310 RepID=UPI000C7CDF70|nr:YfhH family protein [Salirhabdus sp. Marseille-P4669]
MNKRYSAYTQEELEIEIRQLTEKARKAEQMGMINEYAVYERKITMAKAYMLDPKAYEKGDIYELHGDPGSYFLIEYKKGVFAWGFRVNKEGEKTSINAELEALPLSMLENFIENVK